MGKKKITSAKDSAKSGTKNKKSASTSPTKAPTTSDMVLSAVQNLQERKGSSLADIKKYVVNTYHMDIDKVASRIRKFLVTAAQDGRLIRTTGVGANGLFKLATIKEKPKKQSTDESKGKIQKKSKKSEKKQSKDEKKSSEKKKPRTPVRERTAAKFAQKIKALKLRKTTK